MQPHEQRVVDEHAELSEKISKLFTFIEHNQLFNNLDSYDQTLLRDQLQFMQGYRQTLELRIARFKKD